MFRFKESKRKESKKVKEQNKVNYLHNLLYYYNQLNESIKELESLYKENKSFYSVLKIILEQFKDLEFRFHNLIYEHSKLLVNRVHDLKTILVNLENFRTFLSKKLNDDEISKNEDLINLIKSSLKKLNAFFKVFELKEFDKLQKEYYTLFHVVYDLKINKIHPRDKTLKSDLQLYNDLRIELDDVKKRFSEIKNEKFGTAFNKVITALKKEFEKKKKFDKKMINDGLDRLIDDITIYAKFLDSEFNLLMTLIYYYFRIKTKFLLILDDIYLPSVESDLILKSLFNEQFKDLESKFSRFKKSKRVIKNIVKIIDYLRKKEKKSIKESEKAVKDEESNNKEKHDNNNSE